MRRRLFQFTRDFFATESAGGIALVVAAASALILANSPIRQGYQDFWHPYQGFISEGLMSIFFFLVGLEIRREFTQGDLRNPKSAALPILAALGGMVTPALIYFGFNHAGSGLHAWAVPMPTDIALSIGALALLGSKIDPAIKIFLLTLAIADDLGSLIVMGIFYSAGISPYKVLSTFGAVFLAWIIPTSRRLSHDRIISMIHPWSSFLVIPVFVLANLGISINFHDFGSLISSPISKGIIIGRVVGKILGITFFAWLSVKFRIAKLPQSMTLSHVAGVGALAGMGLTVSLFIADLAIGNATQMAQIKIGLIVAALISAVLGLAMLGRLSKKLG
jgi:NhaA family Na+:H+ antiporter